MKQILTLSFLLFLCTSLFAQEVPRTLSYQGILVNSDGTPLADGEHQVTFRFYGQATGGNPIITRGPVTVTSYKGLVTFMIGTGTPSSNSPLPFELGGSQHYVEVVADGVTLSPRVQLASVPHALQAQNAYNMDATGLRGEIRVEEGRVAIGKSFAEEKLDVNGTVKATRFVGDGSGLTNLPTSGGGDGAWNRFEENLFYLTGNVGIGTDQPESTLQLGGYSSSDQYLTIATAGGNRFVSGIKLRHFNNDNGWNIQSDERAANFGFNITREVSGNSEVLLNINGQGTVTAKKFVGDGSGLTNLPAANSSGQTEWAADDLTVTTNKFVGIGTSPNGGLLHVKANFPISHAVRIENASSDFRADGLLIELSGMTQSNHGEAAEFITFKRNNDVKVGKITGFNLNEFDPSTWTACEWAEFGFPTDPISLAANYAEFVAALACQDGGVAYVSGNGDYAEFLERENHEEDYSFGMVVGIRGGKVSRMTEGAEQIMVISAAPIVLGNAPSEDIGEENYEKVAFMGQVPVAVVGSVNSGDYLIPSGKNDGTAVAIAPEELEIEHIKLVIGRAWETKSEKFNFVNTVVGVKSHEIAEVFEKKFAQLAQENQQLKAENKNISEKLAKVEQQQEANASQVASLASQMERMQQLLLNGKASTSTNETIDTPNK